MMYERQQSLRLHIVREGDVIVETNGNEHSQFSILLRSMRKHMERLNLIVVSCGELFVSLKEWACNAVIAHTRVIVLFNRYKKEYY